METIADAVEELRSQLEWSDEANALGDVECDYGDDQWGRLTMGPVRVEWTRDMHGDGDTGWIAVEVSYDGIAMEDVEDYGPDLDDAVKAAAWRTDEWQYHRCGEIRDDVVEWLEQRGEAYDLQGPQDVHDAWTILWRDVSVRGYFGEEDGTFEWSVMNPESTDYLDGDADSTDDDVIEAIETCATDPMVEAWVETLAECTAEDDWSVRVSDDGMTVRMSEPTYTETRRATYERTGFGEGRIELEYKLFNGMWHASDESLPDDEDTLRDMAREAYAWVKAVSE